ncbi:helix-turn-helix transcriptional regulator [Flagellimonas marina]|uniref:Helix-turn-helix transcriptional regulator n=1 Tax=Flagellimonas marina TaxID=1775168 RepID=A0ABV8PFT0_9FLAO
MRIKNLSQEVFGKSVGITQKKVSNILLGKTNVSVELLANIAAVYNYSVDSLMFEKLDNPLRQYSEFERINRQDNDILPIEDTSIEDLVNEFRGKMKSMEDKLTEIHEVIMEPEISKAVEKMAQKLMDNQIKRSGPKKE